MRKRHHVVSAGYQRFFADGETIVLCDKADGRARPVGVRDAFVRKHFSSATTADGRSDPLEDEWQRLEEAVVPLVARLVHGAREQEPRDALKVLAALHFGRSYGVDSSQRRIVAEARSAAPSRVGAMPEAHQAFRRQYGRDALPGEIESIVEEASSQLETDELRLGSMARGHNFAVDKLRPLFVQLVDRVAPTVDFITGDTPFVHMSSNMVQVGLRGRLALGDASKLYLPISPARAAMFTTKDEGDVQAPAWLVQQLNTVVWRAAYRQVACHPRTDLWRALGGRS